MNESRPRAIRAVFHNILFDRMRGARAAAAAPTGITRTASPQEQRRSAEEDSGSARRFQQNASLGSIGESGSNGGARGEMEEEGDRGIDYLGGSQGSKPAPSEGGSAGGLYDSYLGSSTSTRDRDRESTSPPATQAFRTSYAPALVPIAATATVAAVVASNYSRPTPSSKTTADSNYFHSEVQSDSPATVSAVSSIEGTPNTSLDRSISPQSASASKPAPLASPGAPYDPSEESQFRASVQAGRPALSLVVGDQDRLPAPPRTDSRLVAPEPKVQATTPRMGPQSLAVQTQPETDRTPRLKDERSIYGAMPLPPNPQQSENDSSRDAVTPLQTSTSRGNDSVYDLPPTPQASIPPPMPSATQRRSVQYDMSDDTGIHSDVRDPCDPVLLADSSQLLAALNFVENSERSESPSTIAPSVYSLNSSPPSRKVSHVGPIPRALKGFGSAEDSRYAEPMPPPPPPISKVLSSPTEYAPPAGPPPPPVPPASFPSTFAKNKRSEDRTAAAALAQQATLVQATRPGRAAGSKGKQRAWQDSDEEEEEAEEESEDEQTETQPKDLVQPMPAFAQPYGAPSFGGPRDSYYSTTNEPAYDNGRHYYENRPELTNSTMPSPAPLAPSNQVPAMSPHGLLHAGLLDKADRSARNLEVQARDTGGPLVSLPMKPPPPQTGLVGAITSHEREKVRTGGVGRALTEQQRERKLAEQRQKQLDEHQRNLLMQQQQQQQQMQYGGYGGYGMMNPMMMNPWMMGGYGGMGMPSPGSQMGGMGAAPMGSPMGGSQMGGPQMGGPQMGGQMGGQMDPMMQQQVRRTSPLLIC